MKQTGKKWLIRIMSTILVIVWMIVIFGYSGQQGEESASLSSKVSKIIIQGTNQVFHMEWNVDEMLENAKSIEYPIRKCAHMTEYAILALLVFGTLGCYGMKIRKMRYWIAVGYVFAYASTDEFHQTFVDGRYGCFSDVCIDTAGAILAMLLLWLVISKVRKHKAKKKLKK